ncbi:putative DNA topoisomerase (ATP-hydrolyzing) [Helianthus anomalus]
MQQIPFQTNKSSLVMKNAELIQNKTLEGISDIRDESDRSGMRIVIERRRADRVLYFSDKGIVYSAPAYKIPECSRAAAGTPLIQVCNMLT